MDRMIITRDGCRVALLARAREPPVGARQLRGSDCLSLGILNTTIFNGPFSQYHETKWTGYLVSRAQMDRMTRSRFPPVVGARRGGRGGGGAGRRGAARHRVPPRDDTRGNTVSLRISTTSVNGPLSQYHESKWTV